MCNMLCSPSSLNCPNPCTETTMTERASRCFISQSYIAQGCSKPVLKSLLELCVVKLDTYPNKLLFGSSPNLERHRKISCQPGAGPSVCMGSFRHKAMRCTHFFRPAKVYRDRWVRLGAEAYTQTARSFRCIQNAHSRRLSSMDGFQVHMFRPPTA